MDLEVTVDQGVLLEASVRFMEDHYPLEAVRAGSYADPSVAAKYQSAAGELGWFGLLVPEEVGGGSVSGNGLVDASLVGYRRGQLLQPGTFVTSNVVAYALATAGSQEQQGEPLTSIIEGRRAAVWAVAAPGDDDPFAGVRSLRTDHGYELSGTKAFVFEADAASWILVSATTDEGPSQFLLEADTEGVTIESLDGLDLSRRFSRLRLDRVRVSEAAVVGALGGSAEIVQAQMAIASVLVAAESVGAMDRDLSRAVEYAKGRIAFGRPIGSFQAIKHLLADSSLVLEMSKAATLAAAQELGSGDSYGLQAASAAKSFVGSNGIDVAQNCFQVYGGIGFTWEHDQHLYLRRITADSALFGTPAYHREALCRLSGI